MKKILIVLLVLFVLAAGGAAVFLFTFDADRYKGAIVSSLEKSLGENVSIGHIGLSWRGGLAFELSNLAVSSDKSGQKTPGIKLDSASASVKFMPLLKKDVQITSVTLEKPYIAVDRLEDGRLLIGGIDFSEKAAKSASTVPADKAAEKIPFTFSIDSINIRDGYFVFRDRTGAIPAPLEVKDLDVDVSNFSLTQPFSFQAAASIFSTVQNLKVSGRVKTGQGDSPAELDNLAVRTDLKDLDIKKLSAIAPSLSGALRGRPEGELAVEVKHLEIAPGALQSAQGRLALKNGKLDFAAMELPLDAIDLEAALGNNEAVVDRLTASVAGGTIALAGKVSALNTSPVLNVRGSAKGLSLAQLVKAASPDAPQLNGHVNLDFEGQAQGLAWESVSRTLNGRARVQMNDGVLLNYNLLRELIDKISLIPGAESAFQANFPQIYRQRMAERSTILKPLDLQAVISNGIFIFNSLSVDTEYALINGAGQVGLDRRLDVRANLIVNQEISQACARAFNPVQLLFNNGGEIVIPLAVQGMLPQVRVLPDTQYITSKLLSGKAQELIQGLVNDPSGGVSKIEGILKKNLKGII